MRRPPSRSPASRKCAPATSWSRPRTRPRRSKAELEKGADFAELAKKKSKDPGSADGGDLGFFTKEQMVPEFSKVAFALEPGKISDPVKSQFGWHVIKVEEKRNRKAPDFEQVKPQIETYVTRKAQADYVAKLRGTAKVERMDQPADAPSRPTRRSRLMRPSLPPRQAAPTARWRPRRRSKNSLSLRVTPEYLTSQWPGHLPGHLHIQTSPRQRSTRCPHSGLPLAPKNVPDMPAIAGVRLATAEAGIRYKNRTDVLLAVFDKGTTVAGVFTKSKCPSAPVEWCRAKLKGGKARALVVNSGNANAFTGKNGRSSTALTAEIAAKARRLQAERDLPRLDRRDRRAAGRDQVRRRARTASPKPPSAGDWLDAAKAIMTTDTFPKVATATVKLGKAKRHHQRHRQGRRHDRARHGDHAVLRLHRRADRGAACCRPCSRAASRTRSTPSPIDGDTSTSDTLLAFATGAAAENGAPKISRASDPRLKAFTKAFNAVLADLAEQVARDGEGARKLVEITVEGAMSKASARKIAMSIANSPLVKTAIAGEDANWGRVVMAVGKAGEPADRDKLSISFNGIRVAKRGARDPTYDEAQVSDDDEGRRRSRSRSSLGLGKGRDRVLTCDLTKEYVAINGDYRS